MRGVTKGKKTKQTFHHPFQDWIHFRRVGDSTVLFAPSPAVVFFVSVRFLHVNGVLLTQTLTCVWSLKKKIDFRNRN